MGSHTVRGDAILLCVKPGGGAWRLVAHAQRIAAGAVLAEGALRQVVTVDRSHLASGTLVGDGALGLLADQLRNEPKHRPIADWISRVQPWALDAVVEELTRDGTVQPARSRLAGIVPESGLDVLDQAAQDEAAQAVRHAVAGTGIPSDEAALVALLLGASGDVKYYVAGAAWPFLTFWSTKPRRGVRRRLRALRTSLPDGPRAVIDAYDKFWVTAHRYDISG
jgi:hypothetical protein